MALLATVSEESEEPSENWAGFPKKKFYITSVNKSKYTFDLKIRGTIIWNELENTVKSKKSLASFKKCVKYQLLDKYNISIE